MQKSSFLQLSPHPEGFSKVLKTLSGESTREELLAFLHQYGSHYVSEALYGSELSCSIYFPSKKAQQQLWLQYQKGERQEQTKTPLLSRATGEATGTIEKLHLQNTSMDKYGFSGVFFFNILSLLSLIHTSLNL